MVLVHKRYFRLVHQRVLPARAPALRPRQARHGPRWRSPLCGHVVDEGLHPHPGGRSPVLSAHSPLSHAQHAGLEPVPTGAQVCAGFSAGSSLGDAEFVRKGRPGRARAG